MSLDLRILMNVAPLLLAISAAPAAGPAAKTAMPPEGTVHVLCSSHNDLGWGGTPEHHLAVQRNVIRQALARMRSDPDYRFNLEMALSLHSFLTHPSTPPEEKDEALKRCREGRVHVGASWSQPPESSLAEEVLVRNFLLARRWLASLDIDSKVYWNMDTPGRALQMGQVCARSGVQYLLTSRHRQGPHRWRSPDGSSVLAWSPWGDAYFWAMQQKVLMPRPGERELARVRGAVEGMAAAALKRGSPAEAALLFSIDECPPQDANGLISAWRQAYPAGPAMRYSTLPEFLGKAFAKGEFPNAYGEQPNVWMYEYHPGHRRSYEAWRRAGERLPVAELWACLDALTSGNWKAYPSGRLQAAWRDALTMDHAWRGGAIDVESRKFWQRALDAATEVEDAALASLASRMRTGEPNALVVFNSLNWARSEPVVVALPSALDPRRVSVADPSGKLVPSQVTADGRLCFVAKEAPGPGWITYHLVPRQPQIPSASVAPPMPDAWENQYLSLSLGAGGITSLRLKKTNRELIDANAFRAGELCSMGTSGRAASESPTIGGPVKGTLVLGTRKATWRTLEHGPVRTVFRLDANTEETRAAIDVICWRDLPRVDLSVDLRSPKIRKGRELRMAFPVALPVATVRYGVPFGYVELGKDDLDRIPGWSYSQIARQITLREANRWISVNDANAGLAIGTSELVFDTRDPQRELALPVIMPLLLASVLESETGDFQCRFSLCPHAGDWWTGGKSALGSQAPLRCIFVPAANAAGTLRPRDVPVTVGHDLLLTALKKAEDANAVVARVVEMRRQAAGQNRIGGPFGRAEQVNLVEQDPKPLACTEGQATLNIGPAEIQTLRLHPTTAKE